MMATTCGLLRSWHSNYAYCPSLAFPCDDESEGDDWCPQLGATNTTIADDDDFIIKSSLEDDADNLRGNKAAPAAMQHTVVEVDAVLKDPRSPDTLPIRSRCPFHHGSVGAGPYP